MGKLKEKKDVDLMLTIFTTCTPFIGERDQIQRNAIESWMHLEPKPEILLMGHEKGIQKFADEYNLRVVDVEYNEYGVPLVDSIFQNVQKEAKNNVLCYTNSDIVHFQCLIDAVKALKSSGLDKYVATGQRYDLDDVLSPYGETGYDFEALKEKSDIHPAHGCDYFIFPKSLDWSHMPRFALGRMKWDTWINADTLERKIPFINATHDITIIHQNHEREYLTDPIGKQLMEQNTQLAGGKDIGCDIASHVLIDGKVKGYWQRYLLPYVRL